MTALVDVPAAPRQPQPPIDGEIPQITAKELPTARSTEAKMNGNTALNGINQYKDTTGDAFTLSKEYAYTPRKLKVFTIGAGFSGLLIAHKFQHRFPEMEDIVEHTIFEAHHDVGGTWLVNNYPGVQCDVPAHIYVCSSF